MRTRIGVSCLLCMLVQGSMAQTQANPAAEGNNEIKWTRQIVEDFFEAIFSGNEGAFGLLSPELAKAYRDKPALYGTFWGYGPGRIEVQELAPDKSEVIFMAILVPVVKDMKKA